MESSRKGQENQKLDDHVREETTRRITKAWSDRIIHRSRGNTVCTSEAKNRNEVAGEQLPLELTDKKLSCG